MREGTFVCQICLCRCHNEAPQWRGESGPYCGECMAVASQQDQNEDPCHGPEDRWCPSCGLGGLKP